MAGLPTVSGTVYASFAYDIGFSIDLGRAQAIVAAANANDLGVQRGTLAHHRRAPRYFQFRPAPLVITRRCEPIEVCPSWSAVSVEAVVYDFGAVSINYRVPIGPGRPLRDLLDLSDALYENASLLHDSRRRVDRLTALIREAVSSPLITDLVEDYAVYRLDSEVLNGPDDTPASPAEFIARNEALLASILRSEREPLSTQEIADALATRLAYGRTDEAVIDFGAALLICPATPPQATPTAADSAAFDEDAGDELRDVLEFANVELLEMRFLDDRLDAMLDQAYHMLSRDRLLPSPLAGNKDAAGTNPARRIDFPRGGDTTRLARLARTQVDGAVLYEAVNNALKLVGDHYLARVYRLAAQRLHLPDWDASILRKLQTIESIYQKISDRQTSRRAELLEWIVIILIALEIVMALVPGLRH